MDVGRLMLAFPLALLNDRRTVMFQRSGVCPDWGGWGSPLEWLLQRMAQAGKIQPDGPYMFSHATRSHVCMDVHTYTRVYIYIHMNAHKDVRASIYTYVCIHIDIYIDAHTYT